MGGASNRTNLRVHFVHRHVWDTIVMVGEGNRPYHQCPKCDMSVLHKAPSCRHLFKDFCSSGEERKRRRLTEEEAQAGTERAITAYGIPLALFTSFKYLEGFILEAITTRNQWSTKFERHV